MRGNASSSRESKCLSNCQFFNIVFDSSGDFIIKVINPSTFIIERRSVLVKVALSTNKLLISVLQAMRRWGDKGRITNAVRFLGLDVDLLWCGDDEGDVGLVAVCIPGLGVDLLWKLKLKLMSVVLADKVADAGATGTKWLGVHNYKVLVPLYWTTWFWFARGIWWWVWCLTFGKLNPWFLWRMDK